MDKKYNPFYDVDSKNKENEDQKYNPYYDEDYGSKENYVTQNYYQCSTITAKPQTYAFVPFFMLLAVFLGSILPIFSIPFGVLSVCYGKISKNKLYFGCGIICMIFVIVMVCNWAYIVVTTPIENINN